ncbi:Stf0 family sulfotransferase [Cohnella suwonensis]|uniref:Stf0 family sulfotransferase n=1 Tax=Cohnella suwonensis TaxID=696072 RepID=A0ABW0LT20_9BACL
MIRIIPEQSYTIWFSQRTGSTLLNRALSATGVAGDPGEWLTFRDPDSTTRDDIERMWRDGMTPNGVFGLKTAYREKWIESFRSVFQLPETASRLQAWNAAFPNCYKHIFMTRRNKVRLAVSWWRAIVSGEWHRQHGEKPLEKDIADQYNFDAIIHLLKECALLEAAIEDFFTEGGIIPLTIVYEDFILDYEGTVRKVLAFLGIPSEGVTIPPPAFDRIADDVAEHWVQRFRKEIQADWQNVAW